MRKTILTTLVLLAASFGAFAHEGVELGPNKGRLVEFASAKGLHAEVTLQGDKFVVGLYDEKSKKPVAAGDHVLSVTTGDRSNPQKLEVEKAGDNFAFPKPAGDDFWLILQVRENAGAKARTARLHYEAKTCSGCNQPEWLCACGDEEKEKK